MSNLHRSRLDSRLLGVVLVLGLLHGLIYVFLVPPWQHYDEPNHFEYVWLVANHPGWPKPGDRDVTLTRTVIGSMLANGFYDGVANKPDLNSPDEKLYISGFSQLGEPPLYYLAASLPLRTLKSAPIEVQLRAARLVSLLFYLLSILAAWGVARQLTAPGNPLRWMAPLFLVFLPGFVDSMSAVNNDAAAVAVFSLFLWGSVRMLRRGFPLWDFLWIVAAAVLSYFTKSTVFIAIPLAFLVIIFSLLRGSRQKWAWGLVVIAVLALVASTISWGDAALWYRSTAQDGPTRAASSTAVLGEHVIRLDTAAGITPRWMAPLFQPVPPQVVQDLEGGYVTLGFWMWADQPVKARTPLLSDGVQSLFQEVELTQEPAFHAFTMQLSPGNKRLFLQLRPRPSPASAKANIYYDGIVLAPGQRPLQEPPLFSASDGKEGEWGGAPFVNLIRNASAESAGPRLRSWADDLASRFLPDNTRPSLILTSLLDFRGAAWFYRLTAERLLRTFWAKFGWGHVPLLGYRPYLVLALFTLAGLAGAALAFWRRRRNLPWDLVFVLGLVIGVVWGPALVRSPIYIGVPHLYFPVARYAYPAIIPTALVLCLGWLEVLGLLAAGLRRAATRRARVSTPVPNSPRQSSLERDHQAQNAIDSGTSLWHRILPSVAIIVFSSLFLVLDVLSILSIYIFYYTS